jgi:50S ribosomal protein L16 3-hydroxylase
MIYIPPGVSHYGVATDDCLSFSIGFRAATHAEMLDSFAGYLGEALTADLTWRDPPLAVQDHPNEITAASLEKVRSILGEYLTPENPELPRWLGRFVSDTKADIVVETDNPFDDLPGLVSAHATLFRNPASHFAFWRDNQDALLFVDGCEYRVSLAFAEVLCREREMNVEALTTSMAADEGELLLDFYNSGKLIPVP